VSDTRKNRIIRGPENKFGWVNLEFSPGENLIGQAPASSARPLLSFIHLSDLHICDAQSPARIELMDRFADPHNPISEYIPFVGAYRAQEILTTQTLETMIGTVNLINHGFYSKDEIDFVIVTGDVTDNAQLNELEWYLTLMDGGLVHPDSGDKSKWEGVAQTNPDLYDRSYWNPEGTPPGCKDDFPRLIYGFPTVPGLTDIVRKPFLAQGLKHKWFAVHGNHDALLQGTVPPNIELLQIVTGNSRMAKLSADLDLEKIFAGWNMVGPARIEIPKDGIYREQLADERRRFNLPSDWARIHLNCKDKSHDGHGLTKSNEETGTKYWYQDIKDFRIVTIDTVNSNGGWMGSIDEVQFSWLKNLLNSSESRKILLFSHHPLHCLFNNYAPHGAIRQVAKEEVTEELLKHSNIIGWFSGHDHNNRIYFVGEEGKKGFWHVITSSLIDWPQQGRLVEILNDDDGIVIATSLIDHDSRTELKSKLDGLDMVQNLAGLSRILSANHWQRRKQNEYFIDLAIGQPKDRNRFLRF